MSIRLMHLADLHLGAPCSFLGGRAAERAKDLEAAFARALSAAPEKGVDAVVVSGDLFDMFNPPADLVARVKSVFEKVSRAGLPVTLIPGTHDSHRYSRSVYLRERFPGVDVLLEAGTPIRKLIRNQTVHFYGYSGERSESAAFRRSDEDGLHIALAHGTVAENEQWTSSPRDYSLTRKDIENSGFHYVALGHHHNFKEYRFGGASAVYPGTLEGLKFGENDDRYLVVADVREDGAAIERTRFNQRFFREIEVDLSLAGVECGDDLAEIIKKASGPDIMARVRLTGVSDFLPPRKELEARLAGEFFHLQIVDETSIFDSALVRSLENERTVQGIFIRKIREKMRQAPPDERAELELALRLTIEQFQQVHHETERALD
jgi:DNA repair exonuclease SbcCD nuclease subunit